MPFLKSNGSFQGTAIGAGRHRYRYWRRVAAALPATEIEADYLGETSECKKKGRALLPNKPTVVTTVAEAVVNAFKEEASTQGLTLGAQAAAGDISAKVSGLPMRQEKMSPIAQISEALSLAKLASF